MSDTTYALLIGINYIGQDSELSGCINDVKDIKNVLINKFQMKSDNIIMLTDDATDNKNKPTKSNIIRRLIDLVIMAYRKQITKLIIHYSGHGYYVKDTNNDETDGWDELICPVDYSRRGFIKDDVLNSILKIIPKTCSVFSLFDCCYSGTILDLKYMHTYADEHADIENEKNNVKCPIVMISGCKDDQYSADAYMSGKFNGAMTKAFLHSLEKANYNVTYFDLLKSMREFLKKNDFTQVPQISSSNKLTNMSVFCRKHVEEPFLTLP